MSALQEFITKLLTDAGIKPQNVTSMTSPAAMETWTAAFTHKSVNGVAGRNYEGLETLGDAYIAAFFFTYVDSILPRDQRTPSYYTELRRYWLGKKRLAEFSQQLGFLPHIKVDKEVLAAPDESIAEDVFEAFFGALITVADKEITLGVGYMYGYNFFAQFIAQHELLLPEDDIFPRKTKLKELYCGLQWSDDVRYKPVGQPKADEITVAVLDPDGDELARGTGRDRSRAEEVAAAEAIRALAAQGITRETIAANRPVDQVVEGMKKRISNYLRRKGNYGELELVRTYRGTNCDVHELRVKQDAGSAREQLIVLSKGYGSSRSGRIDALTRYINEQRI